MLSIDNQINNEVIFDISVAVDDSVVVDDGDATYIRANNFAIGDAINDDIGDDINDASVAVIDNNGNNGNNGNNSIDTECSDCTCDD